MQRAGRAGHSPGSTSHGLLVATNVNDLVECAATARLCHERRVEETEFCSNPLDVAAQHLVGMALEGGWTLEDAEVAIRRAEQFRTLSADAFAKLVRYLQGGGVALEKAYSQQFARIAIGADGCLTPANSRFARDYLMNVGTITGDDMARVVLGRKVIGEVEEDFARRLSIGDVFVLNARLFRVKKLGILEIRVETGDGRSPTIPRWNAGKIPLASGVASEVSELRGKIDKLLGAKKIEEAGDLLVEEWNLSIANAEAVLKQFRLQRAVSRVPVPGIFLVEIHNRGGLVHLFFHSLIGRAANDALSRIVSRRIERLRGGNTLVTIDDYGFLLVIEPRQAPSREEIRLLFSPQGMRDDLDSTLATSELVRWHFRGVAQTGLMVLRNRAGKLARRGANHWDAEILLRVLRQYLYSVI